MTMVIKKVMPTKSDIDEMIQKVRSISKKHWRVMYSTNKEDRLSAIVIADTYTGAYLEFMGMNPNAHVVDISEVL